MPGGEAAATRILCPYANPFDLVWRRCWRRPTVHLGLGKELIDGAKSPAREVTIGMPRGTTRVWWANLLEEPQGEIAVADGKVTLAVRPHMIGTVVFA